MEKLISPFQQIKKAVDLFSKKENFIFLVKIYLPVIFFPILSIAFVYLPFFANNSGAVWFLWLTGAVRVLDLVVGIFVTIAAIMAIAKVIDGKKIEVGKVFKNAWKNYWKFLLFSIVTGLICLLGFALLVIPGIILMVWFTFSRFIIIEKGLSIRESLLKSKAMVKGRFWKILWRVIVFGVFCLLVEIILSVIPFGIGSVIWTLFGALTILPTYLLYRELSG